MPNPEFKPEPLRLQAQVTTISLPDFIVLERQFYNDLLTLLGKTGHTDLNDVVFERKGASICIGPNTFLQGSGFQIDDTYRVHICILQVENDTKKSSIRAEFHFSADDMTKPKFCEEIALVHEGLVVGIKPPFPRFHDTQVHCHWIGANLPDSALLSPKKMYEEIIALYKKAGPIS